ncbi:hypothetical protein MUBE_11505 [Mycobacterium uberis]|uniref:Uncharacterized protein n=1 Tax=Mycobacterium uberis TaxID=2162698 RepID=A0A3E1HF62_9MYCO|nr:hypothetical protein MUBE_11505 [Mycobacterium uberis]
MLDKRELIIAPEAFYGIFAYLTSRNGHVAVYYDQRGCGCDPVGRKVFLSFVVIYRTSKLLIQRHLNKRWRSHLMSGLMTTYLW